MMSGAGRWQCQLGYWVLASALELFRCLIGVGELVKRAGALRLSAWLCMVATLAVMAVCPHPPAVSGAESAVAVYAYRLAMALLSTVLPVVLMNGRCARLAPIRWPWCPRWGR